MIAVDASPYNQEPVAMSAAYTPVHPNTMERMPEERAKEQLLLLWPSVSIPDRRG